MQFPESLLFGAAASRTGMERVSMYWASALSSQTSKLEKDRVTMLATKSMFFLKVMGFNKLTTWKVDLEGG